jgi:predicted ATPase/DNA-binding CsgD family transcriptional regulator
MPVRRSKGLITRRGQLAAPSELSNFVGRESELRRLRKQVGRARLQTLVGAGGVGKTRLALRLAASAGRAVFGHDVWLVELADAASPGLVGQAVANVLGIHERLGQPWDVRLVDYLRSRHVLLILDSCEHVVADCAPLVRALLRGCPNLHVLATSREPLGVSGEVVWRVAPLSLPGDRGPRGRLVATHASEAVRLFVARAGSRQAPFVLTTANTTAVVDICRRVGGLPLAIELVAARVHSLGVAHLAARLNAHAALDLRGPDRAAPARQRTLRATLDWSYHLLGHAERVLLRRLAVFVGGWSLDAAEAVCADDASLPTPSIAPTLDQLVMRSLVTVEHTSPAPRYRLSGIVRHYARELLGASGEEEEERVRCEHARHMLAVAESPPEARLDSGHVDALARDQANLHSALRWALRGGAWELANQLGIALYGLWYRRGQYAPGVAWLRRCLGVTPPGPSPSRAEAATLASHLALLSGDVPAACVLADEAVAAYRVLGDQNGVARASHILSQVALCTGDLVGAQQLCDTADASAALALPQVAEAAVVRAELGDDVRARDLASSASKLARASGDDFWLGRALHARAFAVSAEGLTSTRLSLACEAVALQRANGDRAGLVNSLNLVGGMALDDGDTRAGVAAFAEAATITQADRQQATLASALAGLARGLAVQRPEVAVRVIAACEALRATLGCAAWPREARHTEVWLAEARAILGPRRFARNWALGRARGIAEGVRTAQAVLSAQASAGAAHGPLTQREHEIAQLLARGFTNGRIALELSLSVATVRTHVEHILAKLEVHSRAQVAVWAARDQTMSIAARVSL